MQQLLKITTTPIKVNVQVERSKYVERKQEDLSVSKANTKGCHRERVDAFQITQSTKNTSNINIKRNHAQVDGIGLVDQMGLKESMNCVNDLVLERLHSEVLNHVVYMSNSNSAKVEPNTLKLEFQPLQIDFDFSHLKQKMEFQPGNLKFIVETYPEVHIEYVGDPIYVPKSSDPNYEGE